MYPPYGFTALTGQNAANTQAKNMRPTMPGYTGLDTLTFDQMRTPEDQIHWLYLYCSNLAKTKADKDYVDEIFAKLEREFNEFKNGEYDEFYQERIMEWIQTNMERLAKEALMTGVWFGLTDDGYFCAYKPATWSDIEFDTGMVYGRSDYGRLILRTNVDGQGVIDNTYRYQIPGASPDILNEMIADLELQGRTLWTRMDSPVIGGA